MRRPIVLLINGTPIIAMVKRNSTHSAYLRDAPTGWTSLDSKYVSLDGHGRVRFHKSDRERDKSTIAARVKKGLFRG